MPAGFVFFNLKTLASLTAAALLGGVGAPPLALTAFDAPLSALAGPSASAMDIDLVDLRQALADWAAPTGSLGNAERAAKAPLAPSRLGPFLNAYALYRAGNGAAGDAAARAIADPLQRTALEWFALRLAAHPDYERLAAFGAAHPLWPEMLWLREEQEALLYAGRPAPERVQEAFAQDPPHTAPGKLALARALKALRQFQDSAEIVRRLWRLGARDQWAESAITSEFAGVLAPDDHRQRAQNLIDENMPLAALRAAALAGPEAARELRRRLGASSIRYGSPSSASLLALARVERRAKHPLQAAALFAAAPLRQAGVADAAWGEERKLARDLIDAGAAKQAYDLCAGASPSAASARLEAAFLSGWIALRFLDDAPAAAKHFAAAADIARTPISIARVNYWRARSAQAMGEDVTAEIFFEAAAAYPIAYYGQLAMKQLGDNAPSLRAPRHVAAGDERHESVRIVALLYDAGLIEQAQALASEGARNIDDEAQVAALAALASQRHDAATSLTIGKIATDRGFALDAAAFPIFGVPEFAPLAHSADRASVFAIARQESEFLIGAHSGMGAKGLMQLLPSTAMATARHSGVAFNFARLISDGGYNAQLGAEYFGELRANAGGSELIAIAAYNAGETRVAQWIKAYGDPRTPGVDAVDWVERVPYDETRDYIQRVSENLSVYRAIFAQAAEAPSPAQRVAFSAGAAAAAPRARGDDSRIPGR